MIVRLLGFPNAQVIEMETLRLLTEQGIGMLAVIMGIFLLIFLLTQNRTTNRLISIQEKQAQTSEQQADNVAALANNQSIQTTELQKQTMLLNSMSQNSSAQVQATLDLSQVIHEQTAQIRDSNATSNKVAQKVVGLSKNIESGREKAVQDVLLALSQHHEPMLKLLDLTVNTLEELKTMVLENKASDAVIAEKLQQALSILTLSQTIEPDPAPSELDDPNESN